MGEIIPPPPMRDASYLCSQISREILSLQYEKVIYVWTCLTWNISMSTCDLFMSTFFTIMFTCNLYIIHQHNNLACWQNLSCVYGAQKVWEIRFSRLWEILLTMFDQRTWVISLTQQYTSMSVAMIISHYWMKEKKNQKNHYLHFDKKMVLHL